MSLEKLKENATQEEINNWIVKATEEYNLLKTSLETLKTKEEEYKNRITSLEQANQNLFTKVMNKDVENDKKEDNDKYIPRLVSEEYFNNLSEEEQENLKELEGQLYGN